MTGGAPPREADRAAPVDLTRSPEEIHRVLVVVRPRAWIPLGVLVGLAGLVLVLLLAGRVPITATGQGLILRRNALLPVQAAHAGQLRTWQVRVGEEVRQGAVLALLARPELEQRLAQARQKLDLLEDRHRDLRRLDADAQEQEQRALAQRAEFLQQRATALEQQVARRRALAATGQQETLVFLRRQGGELDALIAVHERRVVDMEEQARRTAGLADRRLLSQDALVASRREASEQRLRLAELHLQRQQLELKKLQATNARMDSLLLLAEEEDEAAALRLELAGLERQRTGLQQQDRASAHRQELDATDLQQTVARLGVELEEQGQIKAERAGRVLELTVAAGRFVEAGERVATLDTGKPGDPLEVVAYFPLAVGKRLAAGMAAQVVPVTVDAARYGGLVGRVSEVAPYPVSPEAAAQTVGLAGVARELTRGAACTQLFVALEPDGERPGRYRWSRGGDPGGEPSSGSLAEVQVQVEVKPPIAFVLPVLGGWPGL
ncbi:MAG: NHLP bacteriocin system secretion protein [Myxococcota bacterium]|nr:NHLP bacteriocin system secretion protein [Myxococcota bacterium]